MRHIEPQAPLLGGACADFLGNWDNIDGRHIDASDGTGEERARTNDNDAIDADMHGRAGDAELILRTTQRQSVLS